MKIIDCAKSYLGIIEGSSEHHEIVNIYNTIKPLPFGYKVTYYDAWCATFVCAMAQKAGVIKYIYPTCSCPEMVKMYKKNKRFSKALKNAVAGNFIIYSFSKNGVAEHVGIIEENNGGILKVIEGNRNDRVAYRTIKYNDSVVMGFCINNFPEEMNKTERLAEIMYQEDEHRYNNNQDLMYHTKEDFEAEKAERQNNSSQLDSVAMSVIAGKYGNGKDRKEKLEKAGYNYLEVQNRVNYLWHKMYG